MNYLTAMNRTIRLWAEKERLTKDAPQDTLKPLTIFPSHRVPVTTGAAAFVHAETHGPCATE